MTTKDVLKKIEEAVITEENAVMLYARHLKAILEWSGLGKEKQKEIRRSLDILISESKMHEKAFKSLRNEVEKEGDDVFEG